MGLYHFCKLKYGEHKQIHLKFDSQTKPLSLLVYIDARNIVFISLKSNMSKVESEMLFIFQKN